MGTHIWNRGAGSHLRRRGLVGALAAVVASALVKHDRALAAHTSLGSPEPLHIGVINDGTNATDVETTSAIQTTTSLVVNTVATNPALRVVQLSSAGAGLIRCAIEAIGGLVAGPSTVDAAAGVVARGGDHTHSSGGGGGRGVSATGGTANAGDGGRGVHAEGGDSASGSGGIGVYGEGGSLTTNQGEGVPGPGVYGKGGQHTLSPAIEPASGVVGVGGGGPPETGHGVFGESTSNNHAGVIGRNSGAGPAVRGDAHNPVGNIGVLGVSATNAQFFPVPIPPAGVFGRSDSRNGVVGHSTSAHGVLGISGGSNNPTAFPAGLRGDPDVRFGVCGTSNDQDAVFGLSASGIGVHGRTSSAANGGLVGENDGTGPGVIGQSGLTGTGAGTGVLGRSGSGGGVHGQSNSGNAVVGNSNAGFGIVGTSTGSAGLSGLSVNGEGILALNQNNTKYALVVLSPNSGTNGAFIRGALVVDGTKSSAVPTSKGLTLLYALETPESLFEDVGRARLANGRARVALDPVFAQTIETDEYEVFTTPRGECRGLFIAATDPRGFEVRELGGGTSSVEFGYRVIGKRKDAREGHRLATVNAPDVSKLNLSVPAVPARPDSQPMPGTEPAAPTPRRAPGR